ncbi:type II toxin-antitoxin system VapC family toxin [Sphingomonas sp. PB2P19]|uniref:type II toxin-antitoxin system VapC family toxin n=1 Tax=Sphingomonas rhamnosi TaxID=3096156 RepID=UPI002FC7DD95
MGEERRARRLVKAVDTNIVARALTQDDPVQSPIADRILAAGAFIPLTVLLETGWLLRSRYGFPRAAIVDMLSTLCELPNVTVDEEDGVRWALAQYAVAGDIADLIHLVSARRSSGFVTFDAGVARAAGPGTPMPIETLA